MPGIIIFKYLIKDHDLVVDIIIYFFKNPIWVVDHNRRSWSQISVK
jgi:hypothetical protein